VTAAAYDLMPDLHILGHHERYRSASMSITNGITIVCIMSSVFDCSHGGDERLSNRL